MKKIIVILGANAVGKSTAAALVMKNCDKSAYVDAEWCRAVNPFQFTEVTKRTVIENIYSLLRNYILCEEIDTIWFPYGFHGERKEIFDIVIKRLRDADLQFEVYPIVLKCSLEENIRRAQKNSRDPDRITRGIENSFYYYNSYDYPWIDTTDLTPEEVAEALINKCIKSV